MNYQDQITKLSEMIKQNDILLLAAKKRIEDIANQLNQKPCLKVHTTTGLK